jgi:carboxypeptidase Taq
MTTIGAHDQRISTRLKDDDLSYGVWASIHEAGHAMYEQGLDVNFWGLGRAKSLGMVLHESQSRLWENIIGRSESFWQGAWETCKDTVPGHFKGITPQTWTAASNIIEPSLVRVAADEVTYHLHIIIRFELEHALITGDLKVSDLPAAWNSKYKEYLHIDVPDDSRGCLQDIHWASGLFGYFPTYSLGSLVSSQVYSQAQKDLPLLAMGLSQDACKALLGYLKQHLYASGDHLTTDEILMKLTGNRLSAEAFKAYLNDKYGS